MTFTATANFKYYDRFTKKLAKLTLTKPSIPTDG